MPFWGQATDFNPSAYLIYVKGWLKNRLFWAGGKRRAVVLEFAMQIHQLNLKFDAEQDRLLVRINTSTHVELRLWLTRRLTVGVLPLLRKLVTRQLEKSVPVATQDDAGTAKVREFLGEIKREAVLRNSDFATPFKEQEATTEPPDTGALLVTEVAITPLPNGHLRVKFNGKHGGAGVNRDVQIDLDDNLMHGFLHLLEKAYVNSQWAALTVAQADDEATSGNASAESRPQYLN